MIKRVRKDKDSKIDLGVNWKKWLGKNETITSSDWFITPQDEDDDLKLVDGSAVHDDTGATVEVEDGIAGKVYELTNDITTSKDLENQATMKVHVVENLYS